MTNIEDEYWRADSIKEKGRLARACWRRVCVSVPGLSEETDAKRPGVGDDWPQGVGLSWDRVGDWGVFSLGGGQIYKLIQPARPGDSSYDRSVGWGTYPFLLYTCM
jgi:hypothetical protein